MQTLKEDVHETRLDGAREKSFGSFLPTLILNISFASFSIHLQYLGQILGFHSSLFLLSLKVLSFLVQDE